MTFSFSLILLCGTLFSQQKSIFIDKTRGYAIEYPDTFSLEGGSYAMPLSRADTHYIAVLNKGKRIIYGDFDDIPYNEASFRLYAIRLAILASAADGPDGSTFCEDIDSAQVRRNKHGVRFVELFLLKTSEGPDETISEIVGPYFVIDISSDSARRSLYLDWRTEWKPNATQINVSRIISENIRLLKN